MKPGERAPQTRSRKSKNNARPVTNFCAARSREALVSRLKGRRPPTGAEGFEKPLGARRRPPAEATACAAEAQLQPVPGRRARWQTAQQQLGEKAGAKGRGPASHGDSWRSHDKLSRHSGQSDTRRKTSSAGEDAQKGCPGLGKTCQTEMHTRPRVTKLNDIKKKKIIGEEKQKHYHDLFFQEIRHKATALRP